MGWCSLSFYQEGEWKENKDHNGCQYREEYRHDGWNYYKCNKRDNCDCFDSYSDCVSAEDIKNCCQFAKRTGRE